VYRLCHCKLSHHVGFIPGQTSPGLQPIKTVDQTISIVANPVPSTPRILPVTGDAGLIEPGSVLA
jgi:hypothetical protein